MTTLLIFTVFIEWYLVADTWASPFKKMYYILLCAYE